MTYTEYDKRVLPVVLLAIIFLSVLLALLLRRSSMRLRSIPTSAVAILLLILEVIKQRWNFTGEFDTYYLPFHYCSLFLVVIPLAELCGPRMSRIFRPIAAFMSFVVSCAMYIAPQGIIGNACETFGQSFYRTHTFIFHHLVVLYLALTVALGLFRPRLRDVLGVGALGVLYAAVAIPLSYKLNTNYCNYLESVIPFMEDIRLTYGQIPYDILLTLCLTVGVMLGSLLLMGVYKLISLCFKGNKKRN